MNLKNIILINFKNLQKFWTYFYFVIGDIRFCCFFNWSDYLIDLSLSNIPVQDIFYYIQLTVNIFTNLATNKFKLYIYHQSVSGKGPNSVNSFLHD